MEDCVVNRNIVRWILGWVVIVTFPGCPNPDVPITAYSGTYCISAQDHVLQINRIGSVVSFTLHADAMTLTGQGTVSGKTMTLRTDVEGNEMVLTLVFADDANSFTGHYALSATTNPYNGTKGTCPDIYPAGDIVLISPYVNYEDMAYIHKGFGCSVTSPWADHSGLDIVPAGDLMPFRAMASGKVVEVLSTRHEPDNNWITSVVVKYNATYRVLYAFENLTPEDSDLAVQLANLNVEPGQLIAQGEILGRLHTVGGTYYHVHVSLIRDGERVCPEPYLVEEAREGLNNLIHVNYPDLQMCYACE
jgi:hypothetical protein